jgi:hypothetical protein
MLELFVVIVRGLALALPWTSRVGLREPGPATAADDPEALDQAPHLQIRDRLFWIALTHIWPNWRMALMLVQPDTVVRWHRDWLRRRWLLRRAKAIRVASANKSDNEASKNGSVAVHDYTVSVPLANTGCYSTVASTTRRRSLALLGFA